MKISSIILLNIFSLATFAQSDKNIVIKAMQDELTRNMTELQYEGFEKPFYIHYTISDVNQYQIASVMGSLVRSHESRNRFKNMRVLVGTYDFNDESLDNNLFSQPEANEIQPPLDDDYFGIRRALWVTTDNVYKNAARQYKKNLETLAEKKKTLTEVPQRRFAKIEAAHIYAEAKPFTFDKAAFERYTKSISQVFLSYPAIQNSAVYLTYNVGTSYFVNSEGTDSKVPTQLATIQVYAQGKRDNGEAFYDQITAYAVTPERLPTESEMITRVKLMCDRLTSNTLNAFDDDYTGPVLFLGEPVAEIFAGGLFLPGDGLIAQDGLTEDRNFRNENNFADSKINKPVLHESLTAIARPTLEVFKGVDLLGSYKIDDEGVVPPAEIVLIENGVLKNHLNNRSLVKPGEIANGHSSGPSVIEITTKQPQNTATLKKRLLEKAKEEGLDYAIIVSETSRGQAGTMITKINVSDGKEEQLRSAIVIPPSIKKLKTMAGAGKELNIYHVQTASQRLASFIVPEALLINSVDVKKARMPVLKQEEYVASPLKK